MDARHLDQAIGARLGLVPGTEPGAPGPEPGPLLGGADDGVSWAVVATGIVVALTLGVVLWVVWAKSGDPDYAPDEPDDPSAPPSGPGAPPTPPSGPTPDPAAAAAARAGLPMRPEHFSRGLPRGPA